MLSNDIVLGHTADADDTRACIGCPRLFVWHVYRRQKVRPSKPVDLKPPPPPPPGGMGANRNVGANQQGRELPSRRRHLKTRRKDQHWEVFPHVSTASRILSESATRRISGLRCIVLQYRVCMVESFRQIPSGPEKWIVKCERVHARGRVDGRNSLYRGSDAGSCILLFLSSLALSLSLSHSLFTHRFGLHRISIIRTKMVERA